MGGFDCFLFDLDGTLVDSAADLARLLGPGRP
jgi:beta-phosphoglucomutase-like phosphatase (HAD superfamily)